jgi:hypothetical protein
MAKKKKYITSCQHEYGADAQLDCFDNMEDAVNEIHEFFLSYGFEIRDGKPFDSGNDDGEQGGFECFEYEMYGDKVQSFVHCDGDGPVADIQEK